MIISSSVFVGALLTSFCSCASSFGPTKGNYVVASPIRRGETRPSSLIHFDYNVEKRLPWNPEGYGTWKWHGHDINYLEMGDTSKPALLLIHGFGASSYHWRHNIPELARDFHVYAFDLLGFGLSSKPIQDYSVEVWRDQTIDFIKEVVQKPTTIAGNSLGGFTALYASSSEQAKPFVNGCILLNGAGQFRDVKTTIKKSENKNIFFEPMLDAFKRLAVTLSFVFTQQPVHIQQILRKVYPVNHSNVDADLIDSIRFPALHPNAAEVLYRLTVTLCKEPQVFLDDLLAKLDCPLLLCWGESDPCIRSTAADRIQIIFPLAKRVSINAGHCPHDEAPEEVNEAIRNFVQELASG